MHRKLQVSNTRTCVFFNSVNPTPTRRCSCGLQQIQVQSENIDVESQNCNNDKTLAKAFRLLFVCMTITGTFDYWQAEERANNMNRKLSSTCLKCYRIAMMVFFVVNFGRYCPTYLEVKSFGHDLLTKLMVHLWYLLCIINAYVCFKMVDDPNRLRHLFNLWHQYQETFGEDNEHRVICDKVRHITGISVGLGWFFNIGNVVFAGYVLYQTHIFDNFIAPFSAFHPAAPFIKAFYLVVHLFLSSCWIFTCISVITVSVTLFLALKRFTNKLEKMRTLTLVDVRLNMESYRQQHNALCEMIEVTDNIFSLYVAASLLISMLLALMLLYNICWYESIRSDPGQLVSHLFWLSAVLSNMAAVTVSTGMINHWAHAPLRSIYNLSLAEVTGDLALQINVFLARLNGGPIGLSACSMFVLDKQTFINLAGALATYFVVLLQFQQGRQQFGLSANSTLS